MKNIKQFGVLIIFFTTLVMFTGATAATATANVYPSWSNDHIQSYISNGNYSTIYFMKGTYNNISLNVTQPISLKPAPGAVVTLNGSSGCTIYNSCNNSYSNVTGFVFENNNGSSTICNMGKLNLTKCTFTNNTAQWSSAIYNEGTSTVTNCTFTNNSASFGGAIYINGNGNLTVTGSTFTDNNATRGAIYNEGKLTVTGSTFTGNNATSVYNEGTSIVTGSTFTGNNATYGGVICNDGGYAHINFNRIVGNGNYELYNTNNGLIDATNNWWGSNKGPVVSFNGQSDINNVNGSVSNNSWLVLSIISSGIKVTQGNSLNIPVDLIYNNQGEDTSSLGYVPNGISIEFITNMGVINSTAFTKYGTAFSTLNFNITAGNVTAFLDNQTISTMVQGVFSSIQSAINDTNTKNGDIIEVEDGTYIENIILNKQLTLEPVNMGKVTIQPLDPTRPVITVTGNKAIITGFNIIGATNSDGIYINSTSSCIFGNNLTGNQFGIYLNNSLNSTLYGNNVTNNSYDGIHIFNSTNSTIFKNNVFKNTNDGIYVDTSNNSTIYGNTISNNSYNGIYFNNSLNSTLYGNNILSNTLDGIYLNNSSANINFNRIYGNGRYGLENQGNGTVNATNNWWGSNNNPSSNIYNNGGNVTSNPWLVLSITNSCDYSNSNGTTHNYIITADLTHNSTGNGTSSSGSIPDGTLINFLANLGTINSTTSTSKGKALNTLNNTSTGITTVSVTLDNQTVTTSINVTNTTVLGIYNTRTGIGYKTIQDAINCPYTLNGDTITLASGTYTENVIVDKNVTIMPASGANVTVQAKYSSIPVFAITSNTSTIEGLNIKSGLCGIDLESVSNCNITGNTISNTSCGIYVDTSNSSNITGNTISNNNYAIYVSTSNSSNITGNTISHNNYGIYDTSNSTLTGNNVTGNLIGISCIDSNSTITGNNVTGNLIGISCIDSNSTITGNNVTGNLVQDLLQIDTTGVVMADSYCNCGPAALATVLQNYFNINVSQDQLATLAGTDESGTTMYGLVQAAQDEGLTAEGLELSVDQLEPGNIVYLTINGMGHYSVITNITSTMVYLADSTLGNINITLANFTAIYSGYALVITNGTNTQNGTVLTNDEMENIKGEGCGCDSPTAPANTQNIINNSSSYSEGSSGNFNWGKLEYRAATDLVMAGGIAGIGFGILTAQPEIIIAGIGVLGAGLGMDAVDPYAHQRWYT